MAHSLSQKKRIRQNAKRNSHNRWRKEQLKEAIKAVEVAVHEGNVEQASESLKEAYRKLDRIAQRGTIHPNKAGRKKAQLARKVASLSI